MTDGPDAAREEAQRDYLRTYESVKTLQGALDFGWDARGRYDEQRIAELERELAAANTLLKTTLALRALGQSAEVKP